MIDKKTLILESTLQLITKNGFHATPVSMIAKISGVAAGTIYRYFKSKKDIINELYTYVKTDFNNAILEGVYENIGVKEEYALKWKNMVRYHINNPIHSNFMEQYTTSPFINEEIIKSNLKKIFTFS